MRPTERRRSAASTTRKASAGTRTPACSTRAASSGSSTASRSTAPSTRSRGCPEFVLGLAVDGRGRVVVCCKDAGVWRWDGDDVARVADGFAFANYPAFGAGRDALRLRLRRGWGANDGCIRAGDEVLSRDAPHFTNGLAVSPDGAGSGSPSRTCRASGGSTSRAARYEEVVRIDGTVPDGLAFDDAGGVLISCYRPDRVYHLSAAGELTVVAEDPQGTLLAAPTNVCFAGAGARPDRRREPRPLAPDRRSTTPACAARRCTGREGAAAVPSAGSTSPRRGSPAASSRGSRAAATAPWNGDWGASWGGGLVTTCGLDNVGAASEGIGLHGTYSSLRRATSTAVTAGSTTRAACASSARSRPATASLRLVDRTTNVADVAARGAAPLPRQPRRLGACASRATRARSCRATRTPSRTTRRVVPPPGDEPERVWEHVGATWARVRGGGIELEVRSNLPRLWQWIDPSRGGARHRAGELLGARPRARPRRGTAPDARARRDARDLARRSRQRRRRDEARPADGGVPGPDPRRGRGVGGRERLRRRSRSRAGRPGGGERRRYAGVTHVDVDAFDAGRGARDARPPRPRDLVARLLPEQPPPRRRAPRGRSTATCAR